MEFAFPTILLVPVGLGLLGFIEPCTVGAHLVFARVLAERSGTAKLAALAMFTLARAAVMGAIGALAASAGALLVPLQTTLWLIFGGLYFAIGLVFAFGRTAWLRRGFGPGLATWRAARSPLLLGVAFGVNIPACAAPVLFALLTLAAGTASAALGFLAMGLFGMALSAPLALLLFVPLLRVPGWLGGGVTWVRWAVAGTFLVLGAWSVWFGLFVDPAQWARL